MVELGNIKHDGTGMEIDLGNELSYGFPFPYRTVSSPHHIPVPTSTGRSLYNYESFMYDECYGRSPPCFFFGVLTEGVLYPTKKLVFPDNNSATW